jgi:hypothetical protein
MTSTQSSAWLKKLSSSSAMLWRFTHMSTTAASPHFPRSSASSCTTSHLPALRASSRRTFTLSMASVNCLRSGYRCTCSAAPISHLPQLSHTLCLLHNLCCGMDVVTDARWLFLCLIVMLMATALTRCFELCSAATQNFLILWRNRSSVGNGGMLYMSCCH